jgi:hypothetical protein
MEGGGLKRSNSPSGPSFAVLDGPAPITAASEGTSGCSRAYNICTYSCKVLQYTCRLSRAALSSATRARAFASRSQAIEHELTAQSMAESHSNISYCKRLMSVDNQLYTGCPAPMPYFGDVALTEVVPPWLPGLQLGHCWHYYFLHV